MHLVTQVLNVKSQNTGLASLEGQHKPLGPADVQGLHDQASGF